MFKFINYQYYIYFMKGVFVLELKKLGWSLLVFVISVLILKIGVGPLLISKSAIDIHLHDTYFVIELYQVYALLFFLAHFVVNTNYSFFTKNFNNFSNTLYLIEIALFYVVVEFVCNLWGILNQGWTSYPPLSALTETEPNVVHEPLFSFSLLVVPFLLYALVFVYRWGKWSMSNKY